MYRLISSLSRRVNVETRIGTRARRATRRRARDATRVLPRRRRRRENFRDASRDVPERRRAPVARRGSSRRARRGRRLEIDASREPSRSRESRERRRARETCETNSDKKVRRFARRRGFVARATVDSIDGWLSRQMTRLGSLGSLGHPRGGGGGRLFGRRLFGRDD